MNEIQIPLTAARLMLLEMQGVLRPPAKQADKQAVLDAIRRMGALQIDTIHVVARSPYLVLFTRLGDYNPAWLDELLAEGKLFEYWAHAACFLPIEDYPLYASRMEKYLHRFYTGSWDEKNAETLEAVLERVVTDGPVRSADFERKDGRKGAWWDWKLEKWALEYLHTSGRLMIARREKFQRVYDLRERVLPGWDPAQTIPLHEAEDALAVRGVRHLGAAPARWVPDYFRLPKEGMAKRLERLAKEERLVRIGVEGWDAPWYVHPENLPLLEWAVSGEIEPTYTTLLSPFDPLVWDRERARGLFGFDYTIECYLPTEKRRYGYFTLPLLYEGALIGRVDAKAHRKEGIFEVKAIHLEPGTAVTENLVEAVSGALLRCAAWHGTPQVSVVMSDPPALAGALTSAISAA